MKMQRLEKLTELELKSFPMEFDESPTTAASTLPRLSTPLPPAEDSTWIEVHTSDWGVEREHIHAPGAPMIKDLDSFTEGTGKGSFDSILDDTTNEQGELVYHPDSNPDSLGLLPQLDPSRSLSIEMWREGVHSGHTLDLPSTRQEDFDREATDAADSLSEINLGSEDPLDYIDEESRMPLYVPTAASVTASCPRVTKRARSRSPEPSRRTRARPRSKSLSSIRPATYIVDGLSSAPPGRAKTFLECYLPPFD